MVGILTFHWAANYGAVLQAFALEEYLNQNDIDSCIINYVPFYTKFVNKVSMVIHGHANRISTLNNKDAVINKFREKYFTYSEKKYNSYKQLEKCENFDIVITGSDQVWNPSFTMNGEGKVTLSYFASFCNAKKIAYAASFGANKLPDDMKKIIKQQLCEYAAISVREKKAVSILKDMALDAEIVCDPTLLLKSEDYEKVINDSQINNKYQVFNYIINSGWDISKKINNYICNELFHDKTKYNGSVISIPEWLYNIKNSEFVVTDSFHGTVFSILFHKPFVSVVDMKNSMNDRIVTLLDTLGLSDRIISEFNENKLSLMIDDKIDWIKVEKKLNGYRNISKDFLIGALEK